MFTFSYESVALSHDYGTFIPNLEENHERLVSGEPSANMGTPKDLTPVHSFLLACVLFLQDNYRL